MDAKNVALVLEGGGTRNSYTAPVIQQLIRDDINVGWVGGVSAGSTHLVNYLSKDIDRAKGCFVDFLANPKSGGFGYMLTGRGYFNTEYVYKEAVQPDGDAPFDYKTFVENQIPFRMGSVRADTGETVNWGREDIPDFETLMMYIRASSTIPGMMPMPYIDGIPYIDGAMGSSGGIPIDIAEQDGFDKFLIILTRPRGFRRKPISRPQVLRRFFRKTPMVAELMISRHERYNASREYIEQLERQGKAYVFYADDMSVSNRERKVEKLQQNFDLGAAQLQKEWPAILDFLKD